MRKVTTSAPSFPDAPLDQLLNLECGVRWQVACGDAGHWRVGFYSPSETCAGDIKELETHDCPEFFLLLTGRLTLVLRDEDGLREVELKQGKPILVEAAHSGYCPSGPHSGVALVVERDAFETSYESLPG